MNDDDYYRKYYENNWRIDVFLAERIINHGIFGLRRKNVKWADFNGRTKKKKRRCIYLLHTRKFSRHCHTKQRWQNKHQTAIRFTVSREIYLFYFCVAYIFWRRQRRQLFGVFSFLSSVFLFTLSCRHATEWPNIFESVSHSITFCGVMGKSIE